MSFYADMQAVASDVLRDFDQSQGTGGENDGIHYVEIRAGNGPADDPGPSTEHLFKLDGAARGVKTKYVDNALILASDFQATVAVRSDVTPNNKGFVLMDGVRYKVRRVDHLPASGTPVAHRLFFGK